MTPATDQWEDPDAPDVMARAAAQTNGQAPNGHALDGDPFELFADEVLSFKRVLNLPPPEPIIDGWLYRSTIGTMPGQYGSLKSFAAINLCMSVATGQPWFGHEVLITGPVVYASLEGAYTLPDRYAGWAARHGVADVPDLFTWHKPLNLLDDRSVIKFAGLLAKVEPVLVDIDTLSKATPGADENASTTSSTLWANVDALRRQSGAAFVIQTHTGHQAQQRSRGFSGFEDDIDTVLAMTGRWRDGPVTMECVKQKGVALPPPMRIGLEQDDQGRPVAVRVGSLTPEQAAEAAAERAAEAAAMTKARVLAMVSKYPGELTKADLASNSNSRGFIDGAARDSVRGAVARLVAEGRVRYAAGRRDGDRQSRDLLWPVES